MMAAVSRIPLSDNDAYREQGRSLLEQALGRQVSGKGDFIETLGTALNKGEGYAAGRIGISEKHWLYHPIAKKQGMRGTKARVFENRLRYQAVTQVGVFPGTPEFLLQYNDFYVERVGQMDYLGLVFDPVLDPPIARHYQWKNPIVYYKDLEPDMSSPHDASQCYLDLFKDKRILLVCPFSDLLAQRAKEDLFDKIWSRTGRKWFNPGGIQSLPCPYGFTQETQRRFGTVFDLYEHIIDGMETIDFDVALIAQGGLSIPLAAYAKSLGRIGIHFGGKLQILFGVIGARWRARDWWRENVFNEHWIDMPESYRPGEAENCNNGAYW